MTTTEVNAMLYPGGIGLIGPLSMPAVVEILYRVKELGFQGSFVVPPSVPPGLYDPVNESFNLVLDLDGLTETERFADCATTFTTLAADTATEFTDSGDDAIVQVLTPSDAPSGVDNIEVVHDTDLGVFHLNGLISYILPSGDGFISNRGEYIIGNEEFIDAELVLSTGTFQIPVAVVPSGLGPASGSSLTISATEWFPFAHENGDPFWDTATGEYLAPT